MSEKQCKDCRNYIQHFTFVYGRPFRVECGHCGASRPNRKKPDTKACEKFIAGSGLEEFANKEYLRKELLDYMLRLELFQEQGESGEADMTAK